MQLNSDILCLALALLTTLLDVDPQRSKRAIRETGEWNAAIQSCCKLKAVQRTVETVQEA